MPITDGPHETPEILSDGVPFISAEAVKNDKLDFNKKRGYISEEDNARFSRKYSPQKGDIYMVKSGATTGNVAKVETDEVFNIWSPLAVMRPNKNRISTDFLFYAIKSDYFNTSVQLKWNMGTQQNIGMGILSNIRVVVPPTDEQTAIAHYLDTKLGEIDGLIDKQQTLLEKLAEQRTAVITHAVTKGLNPAAPMKNSGVEWLGDVPAHWDEGKLKNICTAFGRIGFRGYSTADLVSEGEGPITLSPSNIKNTNMDYEKCTYLSWEKYLESPEIMLHKNDIVIVKTGSSYGKVGFIDDLPTEATINPQLLVIKRININSKYLFYILLSEIFQFQINQNVIGSTIPTISESKILNFNTPYPSDINEQTSIAEYLDQETAKIDRLCETVNQTIGRLKEYRTALITQAVTGKIKVTN